jgi:hypothetical protein
MYGLNLDEFRLQISKSHGNLRTFCGKMLRSREFQNSTCRAVFQYLYRKVHADIQLILYRPNIFYTNHIGFLLWYLFFLFYKINNERLIMNYLVPLMIAWLPRHWRYKGSWSVCSVLALDSCVLWLPSVQYLLCSSWGHLLHISEYLHGLHGESVSRRLVTPLLQRPSCHTSEVLLIPVYYRSIWCTQQMKQDRPTVTLLVSVWELPVSKLSSLY